MKRLRLRLLFFVCRVVGHPTPVWFTGTRKEDEQPTEVLACPRCHKMFDVRRGGTRKARRAAQRKDWRQQSR